jgi:hypothetical protein
MERALSLSMIDDQALRQRDGWPPFQLAEPIGFV